MKCNSGAPQHAPHRFPLLAQRLVCRTACLILLIGCVVTMCALPLLAQSTGDANAAAGIKVTQILGFEGAPNNSSGMLSIQGDALQFKKNDAAAVQVSIASIQDIAIGAENKQVGGMPMTLGKAAVPYGGGRVISLFSHKKYDSFTVQYVDSNGGLHGAIFLLAKGAADDFRSQLVAKGAHVVPVAPPQTAPEAQNESK
jgi:hypothetical protein